jgi:hypothetical protein
MHRSMPHMETFHLQPRSIRTRSMTSCDAEYDMDECEGAEASGAKLLASLLDLPFAVVSPTMPRSSEEATCDPTAVEHPVAHSRDWVAEAVVVGAVVALTAGLVDLLTI